MPVLALSRRLGIPVAGGIGKVKSRYDTCLDDKPGMYLEPGQIVTMPLRDLAPSFVTKCRERFHARGPQRGNVGGEHGGHTEHDE